MEKSRIALYISCVYAALLALGAIGELFGVGWINSLPIFRGP